MSAHPELTRFVLVGAVSSGKSTLFNALYGVNAEAVKTQAVEYGPCGCAGGGVDTPGEFFSHPRLYPALINTVTDADVLVYVHAADEPECRLPAGLLDVYEKRRVLGVITRTDMPGADVDATRRLLQTHGLPEPLYVIQYDDAHSLARLRQALGMASPSL